MGTDWGVQRFGVDEGVALIITHWAYRIRIWPPLPLTREEAVPNISTVLGLKQRCRGHLPNLPRRYQQGVQDRGDKAFVWTRSECVPLVARQYSLALTGSSPQTPTHIYLRLVCNIISVACAIEGKRDATTVEKVGKGKGKGVNWVIESRGRSHAVECVWRSGCQ